MRASLALASLLVCAGAHAELPARLPRAPLTEVARAQVGAELAVERFGVRGEGSVLCLVDTGVDPTHPELGGRVRWVLDPFAEPRGHFPALEARFGGAVWRGDEDGLPGDPHGHGTAMASIALGVRGVAPAATVIAVRAHDRAQGGFPDGAVVEGVRFCREVAASDASIDPARMIVLLSLGGHDGAHDGRGAFERALERAAGEAPVVVAAGNDGARPVRATGRLFAGERSAVDVHVPRSRREDAFVALTVRAGGALAIEAPDGTRAPLPLAPTSVDLPGARATVEPVEDDAAWRVRLAARGGALASGTYRLHVEGPSSFEVWLAGSRLGDAFFAPSLGGPHVRADEAITIPATASGLIAVGATIARDRVETDRTLELEGAPGEAAAFSSLGPAPSGAPKPDLAAPGGWILAALSTQVRDGDPDNIAGGALSGLRAHDGRIAVRGTSAAAAIVAGALLLALELDPSRGPDARALLVASARGDGAWSPATGAGELDVPRLLALWSGGRDERGAGAWIGATRALAPTDDALWIAVRARGAPRWIELSLGGDVHRAPLAFGTAQLALPPPAVEVGSPLRVEASIDGAPLAPIDVPVVLERGERGAVAIGGGCAIGRRGSGPLGAVLAIALGAAAHGRRPLTRSRRARPCRRRR